MFRLLWSASVATRYFLRRYKPTNIALDAIRARRGLKWGIPAMLIAVPYLYAANICVTIINNGRPGWLHLLVILFHLERVQVPHYRTGQSYPPLADSARRTAPAA